jgi:hypothetical protein
MLRRMKRLGLIVVLLAVLVPTAAGRTAVLPSIYVDYDDDCVFTMHADGGITLASTTAPGTPIPPGDYQVVLRVPQDAPSCPLVFQLQGPGVQLRWDFAGEALGAQMTETLQPAATYVATDLRNPARFRIVFSTSASGSSSSLVGQTPSTATGKGQTIPDPVGSAVLPFRGVLALAVATSGPLRLEAKGKAVHSLRAGRYRLDVRDGSPHAGLVLTRPNGHVMSLSGTAFVGTRTRTIALQNGTWRFQAALGRHVTVRVS